MSYRYGRTLSALLAIAFVTLPLRSQPTGEHVRGELRSDSPRLLHDYFVDMVEAGTHNQTQRVGVNADGRFEFRDVAPGEYVLHVTTLRGEPVCEQYVTVYQHISEVEVRLPESPRRPSAPGTVSLYELSHPPAKKAVKAFYAAVQLSSGGSYERAAEELTKAIRISPDFAAAYTNLAVQHMHLGRYQEAADETAHAIRIAGPDARNLCNLAFAQIKLGRSADAVASARAALRLDSGFPSAHLILGSILANDPATRAEAVPHLEQAARTYPSARATLDAVRRSFRQPAP